MSLFGNKKRETKSQFAPTESARVNESTIVDVWIDETNGRGCSWGLSRVNPSGGRSFRTLKPDGVVDAVDAIAFISGILAKDDQCPLDLQNDLEILNRELLSIVEKVKANSEQQVNGKTDKTSLLSAA